MPGPLNTLLIEGSFAELSEELARYLDEIPRKQTDHAAQTWAEVEPLLQDGSEDEVLKKLVTASAVLNAAPERGVCS